MTKQKKIMLGALAAIGGILLYARAKKKRDLTDSVDDLKKSFIAYTNDSGDLISDDGTSKVNIPNLQKSNVELLKQYGIEV